MRAIIITIEWLNGNYESIVELIIEVIISYKWEFVKWNEILNSIY
jgi:hypothetical protein